MVMARIPTPPTWTPSRQQPQRGCRPRRSRRGTSQPSQCKQGQKHLDAQGRNWII